MEIDQSTDPTDPYTSEGDLEMGLEEENHRQGEGNNEDKRREIIERYGGDGIDAQPPEVKECDHCFVNVGFHFPKFVCKLCNVEITPEKRDENFK
jgi:hypothetical protein